MFCRWFIFGHTDVGFFFSGGFEKGFASKAVEKMYVVKECIVYCIS